MFFNAFRQYKMEKLAWNWLRGVFFNFTKTRENCHLCKIAISVIFSSFSLRLFKALLLRDRWWQKVFTPNSNTSKDVIRNLQILKLREKLWTYLFPRQRVPQILLDPFLDALPHMWHFDLKANCVMCGSL